MNEMSLMYTGIAWAVLAVIWLSCTRRLSCWPTSTKDYLWPLLPPLILGAISLAGPASLQAAVPILASLAIVIWAFLSVVWVLSVLKRDSSIMDMAYALCCVVATWIEWWLLGANTSARTILILVLVNIWGWRYTIYIVARNLPHGEDARYARWRARTAKNWWWWSYFQVFLVQGVMIWLWFIPVALALRIPGSLGPLEYVALAVWLLGFVFEAGADWQLANFKRNPANRGKVMESGLWSQSRHPNYFGEATIWFSYGLLGLAHPWGWLGLLCTAYTVHMMNRGSATKMTDGYMKKKKPGYLAYASRTPSFVPRMLGGRPDRIEESSTGEST